MRRVREQLELDDESGRGRGIRIALLCSGVDVDHPDLADRVDLDASRSCSISEDLHDRDGRGTHLAGIIVGTGALSEGMFTGLAPEAELVVIKITNGGTGPEGNAIKGVEVALAAEADIICYAYGHSPRRHIGEPPWVWPDAPSLLEEAFQLASERGVLSVVSAGDEGPTGGTVTRPGGLESVLTVGASMGTEGAWLKSGRGPYYRSTGLRPGGVARQDYNPDLQLHRTNKPDIVMPGIPVTAPRSSTPARDEFHDPRYVRMEGTGPATAVAAGFAACLLGVARRESIDLGPNPTQTAHNLICHAGRTLEHGGASDFGHGVAVWPVVKAALQDYGRDPQFRDQLLKKPGLQLL